MEGLIKTPLGRKRVKKFCPKRYSYYVPSVINFLDLS